jgi:hypothetical protein
MSLFQDLEGEKGVAKAKAMDAVNDKFGEHSIIFASALSEQEDHKTISPACRLKGVRKSGL